MRVGRGAFLTLRCKYFEVLQLQFGFKLQLQTATVNAPATITFLLSCTALQKRLLRGRSYRRETRILFYNFYFEVRTFEVLL